MSPFPRPLPSPPLPFPAFRGTTKKKELPAAPAPAPSTKRAAAAAPEETPLNGVGYSDSYSGSAGDGSDGLEEQQPVAAEGGQGSAGLGAEREREGLEHREKVIYIPRTPPPNQNWQTSNPDDYCSRFSDFVPLLLVGGAGRAG